MRSLLAAAVHNNAAWCDAICRALGCQTTRVDHLWINASPGPPYYPNAVTLDRSETEVQLRRVRSMLDSPLSRPWAIKDSFHALDLSQLGFQVLFEATWIGLPVDRHVASPAQTDLIWHHVRSDADLLAWETFWGAANTDVEAAGFTRLFQPTLLLDPDIRFLAGTRNGRIVAVAIANRSDDGSGPVVGMSNVMLSETDLRSDGHSVVAAVRSAFPDLPVVGYEQGDDLNRLLALGFESLGPLQVWEVRPMFLYEDREPEP